MGLDRIFQRVCVMNGDVQRAVKHGGKKRVGAFDQLMPRSDIVVEFGPCREQRASGVEFSELERRHRSRCIPEADEQSAFLQA
jgi:hypothetical protein